MESLTRATVLAWLPELGTLERRQIAALVGVAPFNRDRGKHQGGRVIWGGRAQVRRILYMATVASVRINLVTREFYQRLRAQARQSGADRLRAQAVDHHERHAQTPVSMNSSN